MISNVVDIRKADDSRDVIHRAVHLLAEGGLVGLPTETEYAIAASCLQPAAITKLVNVVDAASPFVFQLAIQGTQAARDYVPEMSRLGLRLTRRCWPGPVAFVFDAPGDRGLLNALPRPVRAVIVHDNAFALHAPAHQIFQEVLRLTPAPLVIAAEGKLPTAATSSPATAEQQFVHELSLIIDDGPSRYGQPATLVRIEAEGWRILWSGVVTETTLRRLASEVHLFVCTGNTCRSPIAEGLFRKLLAERLQCSEDELIDRGFVVLSAGLAAVVGAPASSESVGVAEERQVDLRSHESQPLTEQLLEQADHIYTMTRDHRYSILSIRPEAAETVELLARDGIDVADPIGGGFEEYRACQQQIERYIQTIVDEIDAG